MSLTLGLHEGSYDPCGSHMRSCYLGYFPVVSLTLEVKQKLVLIITLMLLIRYSQVTLNFFFQDQGYILVLAGKSQVKFELCEEKSSE